MLVENRIANLLENIKKTVVKIEGCTFSIVTLIIIAGDTLSRSSHYCRLLSTRGRESFRRENREGSLVVSTR
jgi:hypothetical protein